MNMNIIGVLLGIIVVGILAIMIGDLFYNFYYFNKLQDAIKSGKEQKLRDICLSDYYKNSSTLNLPAVCVKYYKN